jgi:signal transduction histidine kinase
MTSTRQQTSSRLDRLIDWFIPEELAKERETRQRARMFLVSHLCGPLLGNVVPAALYFLDPRPGYPVAVLGASITAFWIFPFILRAFGNYNLLAFISIQNLIFCIFWSCYFYGGVTSPTLPWVVTIPLLAFFYLGPSPRLRLLALGQFILNFLAFFLLSYFRAPAVNDTPLISLQGLGLVSTIAAAAYVSMMALYYARIVASGAELESEMRGHLATAAALRHATAQAERAGAAKAEFVASMSHELRTPLNAVIGYSQMLLEDAADKDDDQSVQDLQRIHSAGQSLLRLVTEVLDLSKIEAGKMDLAPSVILVSDLLNQLADKHRPALEAKHNTLTLEFGASLGKVRWDASRMAQAIGQVLDNAIKFTDNGQITLTARRQPGRAGDDILIDVRDTGIGIAPDVLPALFETFTGAHDATTSKYGDRGLGLTLSLALCQLVNGDITAQSAPGRGSCFTLRLPADPSPAESESENAADLAAA